jgi:hypothetical protein
MFRRTGADSSGTIGTVILAHLEWRPRGAPLAATTGWSICCFNHSSSRSTADESIPVVIALARRPAGRHDSVSFGKEGRKSGRSSLYCRRLSLSSHRPRSGGDGLVVRETSKPAAVYLRGRQPPIPHVAPLLAALPEHDAQPGLRPLQRPRGDARRGGLLDHRLATDST